MEILFLSPSGDETRTPGAAVMALAKRLRDASHNVTVIAPLLSGINVEARSLARRLTKLEATVDGLAVPCTLYDGRTARGVQTLFIGNDDHFGTAASLDDAGSAGDARRMVFAQAAAALASTLERTFDVVHAFGPAGALALARLSDRPSVAPFRAILSIDDDAELTRATAVASAAVTRADAVVVPSRHAVAKTNPLAASVGARIKVVPAGVDASVWNPATDAIPASRFDPMDLAGKEKCRRALATLAGLTPSSDAPVLGVRVDAAPSGALARLVATLPDVLRNDCRVIVLGDSGDASVDATLADLRERFADRLGRLVAEETGALHHLLAGADAFIVLGGTASGDHLKALRYGALPIAPRSPAVEEDLIDLDASLTTGIAFLYEDAGEAGLLAGIRRALAAHTRADAYRGRQSAAMRTDRTMERAMRLYEAIYRVTATPALVPAESPAPPAE